MSNSSSERSSHKLHPAAAGPAHRAAPYSSAEAQGDYSAAMAVSRFLRTLQVLLRAARLYGKNHPKETESLEAAERELHAALRLVSPVGAGVEHGGMSIRGRMLADHRGELKALAEELARHGVSSLSFSQESHLGELGTFARLLDGSSASRAALKQAAGEGREVPAGAEWARLLGERRIRGIRINAPLEEKKADAALTSLVTLLLGPSVSPGETAPGQAQPGTMVASLDELAVLLDLQRKIAEPLSDAESSGPQEVAQALRETFAEADPRATALLVAAMHRRAPRPGEHLQHYFECVAEQLALEFAGEEFRTARLAAPRMRDFFEKLAGTLSGGAESAGARRASAAWTSQEARAESLCEQFWSGQLAGTDSAAAAEVLRGRDAWCVPVTALRSYLESLAESDSEPVARQTRALLVNYARGLESENFSTRQAAASGLSELGDLVETLWPKETPAELSRAVERALVAETAPEVAGVLSAVADRLARLALEREDFAEFERMLDALEKRPRSVDLLHLGSLARRFLQEDRWQLLADAALAHRPLHPSLPRILGRDPERLLDLLSARLNSPAGNDESARPAALPAADAAGLPAMARLLRAIGEPATGALVARVFDPRAQRATAAVKLLTMTQPARLLEVLPRAMAAWDWNLQDMAVGELVRAGTPGCASAFLESLPQAHALVVPMLLDEIGLARETSAIPVLLEIAAGKSESAPGGRDVFVRIKAIEALGRLGARESAELLRAILRDRNGLTHVEPAGLRAAAEEALGMMENHPSSVRVRKANDALAKASMARTRPRRYMRVPLESPLAARIEDSHPVPARVTTISLGGAFLESSRRLRVGDSFNVAIRAGLSSIHSTAVVRNLEGAGGGVEFVHMKQDDREKLRKLVQKLLKA